ncbi:lipid IV(A) 3-deoxy-D-manno-octulosonic acid transferase [Cognatishimia sp. WU-CL00825]|uniref:3-deoxy-D-manno-octulosonic acid transferase n=1 Tax=Cognatishimia sp. WU-CL00825 TaxID=3127658 RepID=UPI003109E8D4
MSVRPALSLPPIYRLYALVTRLFARQIANHAVKKLQDAGVSPTRAQERLGHATLPRPTGKLVWIHAVSVGEFQSILGLLPTLIKQAADTTILVTTTTATAAKLAETRLPERCLHQYSPLDTAKATQRFLTHWHPDMAVFVESEIWPRQIVNLGDRGIPLALINARLSEKSIKSWSRFPRLAKALLSRFSLVLCQTQKTATALTNLGANPVNVSVTQDLKISSDPLPVDENQRDLLASEFGQRPLWLASSTHPGEEELVASAHKQFQAQEDDALLVLLPRHPERGDAIATMLKSRGWTVAQRSKSENPNRDTEIYLADTLGETGLFYSLAPQAFIGGSFVPVGGHNPFEPAHFNCAILHGPLYANFAQAYADLDGIWAARQVDTADQLGHALLELHASNDLETMQKSAYAYVTKGAEIRKDVSVKLLALLHNAVN